MSKTSQVLKANHDGGRGSLIGYFPAGYPTMEQSIEAAIAMCKNGVDILEFGIPYSDPVMDGIIIQEATEVSLANGFKLSQVFDAVEAITAAVETPVLVMTYWNPVLSFGVHDFARRLHEAGGAGLITPDLIPDEADEWLRASDEFDLDRVFLAAPTSTPSRVNTACELSRGFVYAVSTMGITGTRDSVDELAKSVVASVRHESDTQYTAVGIGISSPEQVIDVNSYADGAIVGSAFIRAYSEGGVEGLGKKVRELAAGIHG